MELAGTVESVGRSVTQFAPGDEVFGGTLFKLGAHAEYVRIVAEEGRLPVLDLRTSSNAQDPNGYEAHQPPLYYALAAPAWRLAHAAGGGAAAQARAAILARDFAEWQARRLGGLGGRC